MCAFGRVSAPRKAVHATAVDRDGVELTLRVLAERGKPRDADRLAAEAACAAWGDPDAPDPARAVVAEHVAPAQRAHGSAVDEAADDRAVAPEVGQVAVQRPGQHPGRVQWAGAAPRSSAAPLIDAPAEVD